MSDCTRPMVAAKKAVAQPTMATTYMAVGAWVNKTCERATTYTPAVTIVAAWIKALTGVGQPNIQGKLRGFAGGADKDQQAGNGNRAELSHGIRRPGGCLFKYGLKIQRSECAEQQEHAQHEAEVANTVDDKGFFAGIRRGFPQEVKTDQQVAAQAHAFPAHEEQRVVGREHQDEHEKHEQVQVGEEAVVTLFVRHIARGIDVNQEADPGDYQKHDYGEMIELQVETGAEATCDNPVEEGLHERLMILREVIQEFADGFEGAGKREARGAQSDGVDQPFRPLAAKKAIDRRAQQRQQRNDPQMFEYRH